ncbi:M28 family peptidase [Flavobacterium sp. SM15]|uniref:M28 family peptidase n=1 Tax=Flavobacterium sp. SM15 TaxID=2908005 RepID=UPI001EDC664A|nr:M28 family peptidase [Flavobacterium sp. SM15]MCG2611856.1 M28 family peptidase [Flavobacterium sp. SM15]
MKFSLRKSLLLLPAVLSLQTTTAQTFQQRYADIVSGCSEEGVLTNLQEFEDLGVKYRGTAALENTYQWLRNKYLSFGYTASQLSTDTFSYSGSTCKNLVVTKIGTLYPNTYVIVCGHYDSITGTGTNDNGSGVATILEIARLMQNIPSDYSIKFINFSGEEDGLRGSQHYVSSVVNGTSPKMSIKVVLNIDEVGGVAGMTNDTITCERDTGSPTTNNAASNTITSQLITCVGLYSPLNTYLSYAYASDYMPFEENNEVITGLFEKNETPHRHTDTDLLENMDPVYVYNISKAATGAMLHFSGASTTLTNDEFNKDFQVSFFPNPTQDFININLGNLTENNYNFSLIDVNGKVVVNKEVVNPGQLEKINVKDLSKGVYLAVLKAGDKEVTKKIAIN